MTLTGPATRSLSAALRPGQDAATASHARYSRASHPLLHHRSRTDHYVECRTAVSFVTHSLARPSHAEPFVDASGAGRAKPGSSLDGITSVGLCMPPISSITACTTFKSLSSVPPITIDRRVALTGKVHERSRKSLRRLAFPQQAVAVQQVCMSVVRNGNE